MNASLGKYILLAGLVLVIVGLFVHFSGNKLNFLGKLPGDINIRKENFSFHFPVVTCLLLSLVITVITKIVQYFSR